MKCARELIEMKKEAIKQWDEETKKDLYRLSDRAISFCEMISEQLEEKALERKPLEVFMKIAFQTNKYGHFAACPLKKDKHIYANGERSYSPNKDFYFDYDFMKCYLKKYCIKIEATDSFFRMYGSGNCPCKIVHFYVPANHEC